MRLWHGLQTQRSYFAARGDAQTATRYANEAAGWAGKAQQSAATAQERARKAGESLQFALLQQKRAHAAADQAENDARAAANNADQAASYAAQAHASADQAAASAAQARSSADAAGHDADLASQAAQEAYNIAWEKQLHEQEQYRAAAAEGELESKKTSLLDAIKQQVGQDAGSTWRHKQKAKIPDHIQRNYGDIHIDIEGFPEFTPHVVDLADYGVANGRKADMVIPLSPKLNDDFTLADERAGIDEAFRKKHGLVWHHHQDVSGGRGRVQLIPSELHAAVKHTGGRAIYREYLKSTLKG